MKRLFYSYDSNLFRPQDPDQKDRSRAELGITPNVPVLAYFGRLVPEKGVLDIPRALEIVLKSDPTLPWLFLCVGNGPLRLELEAALSKLPADRWKVVPAVPHDQVGKVIGTIDALLLPSRTTRRWKEQFGRVLVEAMACRSAVIGSDSGEIPHLIRRSEGGWIFREGDVNDLAEKILDLLRSPIVLQQHKEKGSVFAREQVSHRAVARGFASDLGLLP